MQFLNPSYLPLLWLLLIPVALWLFRRKAKRVQVSTLLFFRTLAKEHQESAWLRRLKKLLALLLTLLVLLLAVLALARPFRAGDQSGDAPKSLVILLDRSASMAAQDQDQVTRLTQARQLLRDRLRVLPENVVASLVVYDEKAEVVQSRSTNRRELLRLVEQTTLRPVQENLQEAMVVAERLAALDAPAEIWHVSDHPYRREEGQAPLSPQLVRYRFMDVSLAAPVNVGITAFQIRPAPLSRNRFDAFVEVSASAANPKPLEVSLEARLDGRPVQLRQLELKPGESSRLVLPLEGGKGQQLEMEVQTAGDSLSWDNVALAPLPHVRPLVVAWIADSPDPFTELALTSLLAEDRIQVLKGGPKDWPVKDKPDVYVFENWLPQDWPTDRPALVLNPPSSVGPIHAKRLDKAVPYDAVRALQPDHPLLFRVTSSRVAVTQSTVLNVGETMETLWMAGNEPVLAAGEAHGQRLIVTAFQPSRSEQLALLSAFPLLIGNAIYWCAEHSDALSVSKVYHTGDVVEVGTEPVRWQAWDGKQFTPLSEDAPTGWLALNHIGIFQTGQGEGQSSLLLSPTETNLPATVTATGAAGTSPEAATAPAAEHWASGGGWWSTLLWIVLGLLLVESWLFHRKAVY